MSDSTTRLKPDAIQLDTVLTVGCSTGQADDTTLTFAGELDAASADQAYRCVRDTIDTSGGRVILDVAGLSFCDARGLGALLRMRTHARRAGSSLYLLMPSPRLVKLIHITGLDEELLVHCCERTEEIALAPCQSPRQPRP